MHWYSTPVFQDACLQVQANGPGKVFADLLHSFNTRLTCGVKLTCICGLGWPNVRGSNSAVVLPEVLPAGRTFWRTGVTFTRLP